MTKKLLQVSPPVMRIYNGELELEKQTCDALPLWLKNFDKIVIACPTSIQTGDPNNRLSGESMIMQPVADLPYRDRIELVPLPHTFKIKDFLSAYLPTRRLLRQKIRQCHYLYFGVNTLIGDWATVACLEAIQMQRPYCVPTARVHHEVTRLEVQKKAPWKRRVKEMTSIPLMKSIHEYVFQQSDLGLLQGQDCYTAYAESCRSPKLVYNVPIKREDHIDAASLQLKVDSVLNNSPLQICYIGRVTEMKGPFDWLSILRRLHQSGVDFKAIWIGEGPQFDQMQEKAALLGIQDRLSFPGYVTDRAKVLNWLRQSHVFLFCHKTRESARCLIEGLISGTPIVGYGTPYPEELVRQHGGGLFAPVHQWEQLSDILLDLNQDRHKLAELIQNAARSGSRFDHETAFQERMSLIKQYFD